MFGEFERQGGLATDGRCKAFADGADGTGWGEGSASLVLERLVRRPAARPRGARVLRGYRGESGRRLDGLTAPNGPSQQRVIQRALDNAGLSVTDVDVSRHRHRTKLGTRSRHRRCWHVRAGPGDPAAARLGEVEHRHTQGAAGVAGVIKMVEALRRG